MKHKIFSVYDSKAEAWTRPMVNDNIGRMLRSFEDLANDKNHPIGQHPEDYSLFEIGEFDDESGDIIAVQPKVSLGIAIQYSKGAKEDLRMAVEENGKK